MRRLGTIVQDPRDFFEVATDNGCVDALPRDRGILRKDPLRRAVVHPVVRLAVHVMIPARALQESNDAIRPIDLVAGAVGRPALGQHAGSILLASCDGPLERRAIRLRPPLVFA
jgi:hypothetical protein